MAEETTDPFDWLREAQRRLEEQMIERSGEMLPVLFVQRQGSLVAMLLSGAPGALMRLAAVAVSGFVGDELLFVADTHVTKSRTNPEGKSWSPGEMQRRASEPAVAALIGEAVTVLRAQRDGSFGAVTSGYERAGGRIRWLEAKAVEGIGGRMIESMRSAVKAPYLTDIMEQDFGLSPQDFDLPPREAEVHRQMATVRSLAAMSQKIGEVVGFAIPTGDEPWVNEIVETSMRRAGLTAEVRLLSRDEGNEWWRRADG